VTSGAPSCDDKCNRCKVCNWPVDSVESLQQHYGYHLDHFNTTVTEDPDNGMLVVRIESSTYEEEYIFSPSRRMKPYPRLEETSMIESARKESLSKFLDTISEAPTSSQQEEEPKWKRPRQEPAPVLQLRGLDPFEGIETGADFNGFLDRQMDVQLLDFLDVEEDERRFASIWNYYRRRLPVLADTGTFDAMKEFIELNIGHLYNYRLQLLQLLIMLWQYRRIGRDQMLECMVLYDRLIVKHGRQPQN